jgi:hypothetical protein
MAVKIGLRGGGAFGGGRCLKAVSQFYLAALKEKFGDLRPTPIKNGRLSATDVLFIPYYLRLWCK